MIESVEDLGLHRVKVRELVELLIARIAEGSDWKRMEVQQLGVRRMDLRKNEVFEGDGHYRLCL